MTETTTTPDHNNATAAAVVTDALVETEAARSQGRAWTVMDDEQRTAARNATRQRLILAAYPALVDTAARLREELDRCNTERQQLAAELFEANQRVTTLKQMAIEAAQVAGDIADGKLVNDLGPTRRQQHDTPLRNGVCLRCGSGVLNTGEHIRDDGCPQAGASVPSARAQEAQIWAVLNVMGWDDDRNDPGGQGVPPAACWSLAEDLVAAVSAAARGGNSFADDEPDDVDHAEEARALLAEGTLPPEDRDYTAEPGDVILAGVGHAVMHLAEQVGRLVPSAGPDAVAAAGRELVAAWRAYPAGGSAADGYATQIGTAEQALAAAVDVADGRMEDNPLQPDGAPCDCWACRAQNPDDPIAAVVEAAVDVITGMDANGDADLTRLDSTVRQLLDAPACVDLSAPAASIAETAAEDQGDEQPAEDGGQHGLDFGGGFTAVFCNRCNPPMLIHAANLAQHNAELHATEQAGSGS